MAENIPEMTLQTPSDSDSADGVFKYEFSEDMVENDITSAHLDLFITGPEAPYTIEWSS